MTEDRRPRADMSSLISDLTDRIEGGEWAAGDRLPPERDLARAYGVARNTLRRALDGLEEQGRLVRHVGRGTFIQAAPAGATLNDFGSRIRDASPEDLMEVRLIIEPEVAALATARATASDLREIEQAFRASLAAKGVAEFEVWDARFHLAIFHAARNSLLLDYCRAINAARNQPRWHKLKQRSVTPDRRNLYNRHHGDIMVALSERDPDAARKATHAHLAVVRDNLLWASRIQE